MESIRQEKYPQPSKKEKKIDCYGYVRTEDRKNTHSQAKKQKNRLLWVCENRRQEKYPQPSKKDNREKKADKKENASYCNLTYNMARFQLHIPQLS